MPSHLVNNATVASAVALTGQPAAAEGGAVDKLIFQMSRSDRNAALVAGRQLWSIVRHAGRPGNTEKEALVERLTSVLQGRHPVDLKRQILWMLSEIAGGESIEPVAVLLGNQELREDARMALERIPGNRSLEALQTALATVPGDFQHALAQSLRRRGIEVPGLPCRKLVPTKATQIEPLVT